MVLSILALGLAALGLVAFVKNCQRNNWFRSALVLRGKETLEQLSKRFFTSSKIPPFPSVMHSSGEKRATFEPRKNRGFLSI